MFRSSGLWIQYNLLVRRFLFVNCVSLSRLAERRILRDRISWIAMADPDEERTQQPPWFRDPWFQVRWSMLFEIERNKCHAAIARQRQLGEHLGGATFMMN